MPHNLKHNLTECDSLVTCDINEKSFKHHSRLCFKDLCEKIEINIQRNKIIKRKCTLWEYARNNDWLYMLPATKLLKMHSSEKENNNMEFK